MHVSVFYQLPICNLFTQHVIYLLWRDTTSELWTPVLFSILIKHPQAIMFTFCNYFSANIIFHSIRLILCASKTGEIDNLTESLGQSILIVLCAGSRLLLTSRRHQLFFWRCCRGFWSHHKQEVSRQGESLTLNLFTLLLFCLFYSCLLSYIENTKKNSYSFYSCSFIYLPCYIKNQKKK